VVTLLKALTQKFDERNSAQEVTKVIPVKTEFLNHVEVTKKLKDYLDAIINDLIIDHPFIKDVS
jgi:hypothetical protein